MAPVILETKSGGLLVIGGSGGSMITSAVALVSRLNSCSPTCLSASSFVCLHDSPLFLQSMINRLWLGMNLKDAIAAKIVFVKAENEVNFEPCFDEVRYSCCHPHCPLLTFKFTRL